MRTFKWYYYVILLVAGMVWGVTIPGMKVVMSTNLPVVGVIFWQAVLVGCISGVLAQTDDKTGKATSIKAFRDGGRLEATHS